ncbi:zinc ribbon domain-containing protein [Candidatus Poribacteria bacterium]|nr:MAG: zinc ribbon domain-containing protein [Candidatus Poribacteria bacterium]
MPIFEYECHECKVQFEVLRRASDADTSPECPRCGAPDPTKRFSAFATAGTRKETAAEGAT